MKVYFRNMSSDIFNMKYSILILLVIFVGNTADAVYFDLNLGLMQGELNTANTTSSARSINSLGVYAHLNKADAKSGLLLGWNMAGVNVKDEFTNIGFNQKLTSTDMGPAFRWYYESEIIYSISYVYGISCKGNYDSNGSEEKLSGSSQIVRLSAEVKLTEKFLLGLSLNNYSANYSSSVSNNIQSDVSYKNNWVYPSLNLAFQF